MQCLFITSPFRPRVLTRVLMLTVPCLGESSCLRAPHPRVLRLKVPLSWVSRPPSPRGVHFIDHGVTRPRFKHPHDVTIPVPLLVTACRSLLIYTSTPLYVTNWQPVIWTVAPPWILDLPLPPLNLILWVSTWLGDTLKADRMS